MSGALEDHVKLVGRAARAKGTDAAKQRRKRSMSTLTEIAEDIIYIIVVWNNLGER